MATAETTSISPGLTGVNLETAEAGIVMETSYEDSKRRKSSTRISGRSLDECEDVGTIAEERKMPWWGTTLIIMGDVMGTGVLANAFAAAKLGWVVSMITLPFFAFCSTYSGNLLARTKNEFLPAAGGYADMSNALVRPRFGTFTRCVIVTNWALLLPYFMVGTGESLKGLAPDAPICGYSWTAIAGLVLVVPIQATTMRLLFYLSAPSSLAVIITIIMVVAELFTNEGDEPFGSAGTVGPPPGTTFFQAYRGLTTIVFAYLGQDVFCEIMQEMAEPKDANKSINLAYSVMTLVYAFTTIVAYGLEGRSVEGFLLDSLPDSPVKRVASGLLAFHVIVAYAIVSVPLTNFFYGLCFPNTPIHNGGVPARLRWALISIGYLVFSYLIATLIPAFSAIQGLIGSLCGSPILFGFPAAFYILACRLNKKKISTFDKVTCALFLCVLCPLFFLCGTIDSIMQIGDAVKDAGTPFSIC